MTNPWTKKNPLMSMWLSAANRAAGIARGQATGQAKRAAGQIQKKAGRDMTQAWLNMFTPPGTGKKRP